MREQPVERQRESRCVVGVERRTPRLLERLRERGLFVEQLLRAVAQAAGLEQRDQRAGWQQIGQQVLVGGQPRQPRLHAVERLALREPLPLRGAPLLRVEQGGRAGADLGGRQQLAHREDPRVGEITGRALVRDRELREPVDIVAPEVDTHGVVGGRRVHVDDRAAHRELTARLHLVLAPVAHRDEPVDEHVAVELRAWLDDDGLDGFDVRAEPLHERAHRCDDGCGQMVAADAQPPNGAQPAAQRLGRGRHPFERERLPRGEDLDGVGAEELAQVGREPLGLDAGRHREHHRPAGGSRRERRREEGARGLRDRDRLAYAAGRGGDDRIVGQQAGEAGERWGCGHRFSEARPRTRVDARDAAATRGIPRH